MKTLAIIAAIALASCASRDATPEQKAAARARWTQAGASVFGAILQAVVEAVVPPKEPQEYGYE